MKILWLSHTQLYHKNNHRHRAGSLNETNKKSIFNIKKKIQHTLAEFYHEFIAALMLDASLFNYSSCTNPRNRSKKKKKNPDKSSLQYKIKKTIFVSRSLTDFIIFFLFNSFCETIIDFFFYFYYF